MGILRFRIIVDAFTGTRACPQHEILPSADRSLPYFGAVCRSQLFKQPFMPYFLPFAILNLRIEQFIKQNIVSFKQHSIFRQESFLWDESLITSQLSYKSRLENFKQLAECHLSCSHSQPATGKAHHLASRFQGNLNRRSRERGKIDCSALHKYVTRLAQGRVTRIEQAWCTDVPTDNRLPTYLIRRWACTYVGLWEPSEERIGDI